MAGLLGIVLPLALGAAVSPTVLAMQLVTLSRPSEPLARAWALAGGCTAVLAGFSVLALLMATSTGGSHSPSEAGAIVKLTASALLVVLGVRQLRAPPRPPRPERSGGHPLRRTFVVGVVLMLTNFSSIVLFFPAMHQIGLAKVAFAGKALAFALLFAITLAPAVGPPLAVALLGERATAMLARLNRTFTAHRRGIGAGLCLVFAVVLAATGLQALL